MNLQYSASRMQTLGIAISDYYRVDIFSSTRKGVVVNLRKASYYVLRRRGITFSSIAVVFNKNHASIMHGAKSCANLLEVRDQDMRKYVDVIELIANEIFQETETDNMRPEMRLNIYRLKFMDFLAEQDNLLPSFNLGERKMMSRKIFNEVHKDFYE